MAGKGVAITGFGIDLITAPGRQPPASVSPDEPFCLVLLGDFSGRQSRGVCEPETISGRTAVAVDRDNLEDVLSRIEPRLTLTLGGTAGAGVNLSFRELDDFHPDRLFERVELFGKLRTLRRRLLNRDTFAAAAAELNAASAPAPTAAAARPDPPMPPPSLTPGQSLLDAALAETEQTGAAAAGGSPGSLFDQLIQEIVAPYVLPAPDPQQAELVAAVDRATGEQMRRLLHDGAFQALEAGWRGLEFLVRRVETDRSLRLFMVDVSQQEMVADLAGTADPSHTALYRLLVEQSAGIEGGRRWAVIAGLYSFGPSLEDIQCLKRLAEISRAAGAAYLSGGEPGLVGCRSFAETPDPDDWKSGFEAEAAEAWQDLRASTAARSAALVLPRFLLRAPYGLKTRPIEQFDFEEQTEPPVHEGFLWGNAAILGACALAQAFTAEGWQLGAADPVDFDGLPLFVYRDADGDSQTLPCGEAWLVERAARSIAERGLTPVLSIRDRDAVRLPGLRSLADPPLPLEMRSGA